jgi:hypothetical protein
MESRGAARSWIHPGPTAEAEQSGRCGSIDQIGFVPEATSDAVVTSAVRMIYHAIFVDPPART